MFLKALYLGPLLFLIYINDIVVGMKSDARIFADDTSLFKVVHCPNTAFQDLNHDLNLIQNWAYQWKMVFNPDPSKPPVEMIFSRKTKPPHHPVLLFNGVPLERVTEHKHLGVILDIKLKFEKHINEICNKASKLLGVMKLSRAHVPMSALEKVYVAFVRSKLEYGDVLFHTTPSKKKPFRLLPLITDGLPRLMQKLETIQYTAARLITGCWKGSSTSKVYNLLGWQYLCQRRWSNQMSLFHKIIHKKVPTYLYSLVSIVHSPSNTDILTETSAKKQFYIKTFFPSCSFSWNSLLKSSERQNKSLLSFKSDILKYSFIQKK